MTLTRPVLLALALCSAVVPCMAAQQPVFPDALQQEAMTCVGEATQLCLEVLTAEDHGLACLIGKRQAFTPRCRVVYDKVAKVLTGAGVITTAARRP